MKTPAWIVLVLATATLTGCGASTGGDPCAGLGCAVGSGSLTLHVRDQATSAPIDQPVMREAGAPLPFHCTEMLAGDAGAVCPGWIDYLQGHHVIEVSAPGHVAQTLTVDIAGPQGCCGQGQQLEQTVDLPAG